MSKAIRAAFCATLMISGALASAAHAEDVLKVAYLRAPAMVPQIHAERTGLFAKEGIKAEIIVLNNGPAVASAVLSGSADIGWAATMPLISARAANQPIRAFAVLDVERWPDVNQTLLIASEKSGVKKVTDLKGRTLASNATNGGCDLTNRDLLRANNVSADDVKLVVMPFPQMKAALELGTVDAVCIIDPFYSIVQQSDAIKPVVLGKGMLVDREKVGAYAATAYFASEDWLKKNEKLAAGFMRAIAASIKDLKANPDKYYALLESEFKIPPALAAKMTWTFDSGNLTADPKMLQPPIDGLVRTGLLKKSIDGKDVVYVIKP